MSNTDSTKDGAPQVTWHTTLKEDARAAKPDRQYGMRPPEPLRAKALLVDDASGRISVPLNDADIANRASLQIDRAERELGILRSMYLEQETAVLGELRRARADFDRAVDALAFKYVRGRPDAEGRWTYDANVSAFVKEP